MKKRILFSLLTVLLFLACSDDDNNNEKRPSGVSETISWIEDTMREWYYWYDKIPGSNKLNYKSGEESFFTSLLHDKDGKTRSGKHYYYSTIEKLENGTRSSIQTDYSYGFEFSGLYFEDENKKKFPYAFIQYVVDNSPAHNAGLKRGDWIIKKNGKDLDDKSFASLLGDGECELTVCKLTFKNGKAEYTNQHTVRISGATKVVDNPVFGYDFFLVGSKKVGYLVYNHFTAGPGKDSEEYDEELKKVSTILHGVNELILDLRYNNGGLVTSAELLSSMLAPKDKQGEVLGKLVYNNKKSNSSHTLKILKDDDKRFKSGKNLNLSRLYVLTSRSTASSSELVINCLKPYMEVILIGEQTEGKDVGSITKESSDKKWALHPIVCKIYNSQKNPTEYTAGFAPDYTLSEVYDYNSKGEVIVVHPVFDLGNPEERLLAKALSLISGKSRTSHIPESSDGVSLKKVPFNSIDRRATNGVVVEGLAE